jgi:hypothetical protein
VDNASHWLLISYQAPSEPSALRVATWRALKQVGAVKLRDGVYFLPDQTTCAAALEDVQTKIRAGGGMALTMRAQGASAGEAASLEELFAEARAEEFRQVAKSAYKFVAHISREEAEDDYRFAEVDALEEELEKVRRQFQRAVARDYLGSTEREEAAHAVADAAAAMGRYLEQAYRREAGQPGADSAARDGVVAKEEVRA